MTTQFTYQTIVSRRGCFDIADVPRMKWCTQTAPVLLKDLLNEPTISVIEKSWFVSNSCDASTDELLDIAKRCTDVALKYWYEKRSFDPTPQNAYFVSPKLAYIVQAVHQADPKDRIYAACVGVKGTAYDNEILEIFKSYI